MLITEGKKSFTLFSLSVASAKLFYHLPYNYIDRIENYGNDSIEALAISLLISLATVLLTLLGTVISVYLYILILKRRCKKDGTEIKNELPKVIDRAPVADFLSFINLPIFTFAVIRFIFSFIIELIDTITFFVEYRSDYTTAEFVTILSSFLLIFFLLIASYLISATIRNKLVTDEE